MPRFHITEDEEKKKLEKMIKRLERCKKAIIVLGIIVTAYIISVPLFTFISNKIDFFLKGDQKEFRVGYPINFGYEISSSPLQAIIIWGDGNTEEIKKAGSGSLEHSYDLQGRYTPTLLVWDIFRKLSSKSLEIKIENNVLQFNIEVENMGFEGQETIISVDSIFELNEDLSKDEIGLNFIYHLSETQILSNESSITYSWKNEGTFPLRVTVMDSQGVISRQKIDITVINKPPKALFTISRDGTHSARTEIEFTAERSSDTINDKDSLQYLWNWGDNTASWGKYVSHSYWEPGIYNVSLCVIDDDGASDIYSQLITIDDPISSDLPIYNSTCNEPFIAIGTFLDEAYEDEEVQFTSEINRNITDFRVLWSFGDGTYSSECAPKHAWSETGIYNVILEVIDSEDQYYTRSETITIKEKAPEILGPYNFQGVEGQALVLDVEVYDSISDMPDLVYEWYDENNRLISNEKKPTVVLDKGNYSYRLDVSDQSSMISSLEINIIIHPISHEVFVANYMYHGLPGSEYHYNDNTGVLKLRAYIYYTANKNSEYDFHWTIKHGNTVFETSQKSYTSFSEISFKCTETTIYQGQVKVEDSTGKARVSTFEIYSFIDSSQNGINDEYEQMLQLSTASAYEPDDDNDNDHLTNIYEMTVSNTSYLLPDTDGDGLLDGYDDSGVGELTLGTNPNNIDTDGDSLKDSTEYYGFDISINYFENRSTFHINSDALLSDTDNDGVSDYEEYIIRSNPRLGDSDCDGLIDAIDPYPTTWDNDNDFLSDFMELQLGTDINISDTDLDGIKDGEEIWGWGILNYKTNPIYKDTDGDFLDDLAEILNYKYSLEDEYGKEIRVNLTHPVSLHFPEFFKTATIAQISFALTFGEYGEDNVQSYGVQDQSVQNLNIIIRKQDENLVLYNSTTNSTRYFSQVVDITDIMNNKSLNYYGDYVIEVKDLNNESEDPKCLLEQFEIQVSRYLNPNDDDFDDDGIFDGVEVGLLVEGTDKIDIHDVYNNTEANEDDDYGLNEFILEIPTTGRVYDGNLVVEIESEDILLGSGNISSEIIKQHVNLSIDDVVLLDEFQIFNENEQFQYVNSLDLSQYVDTGIITEYCENYLLKVNVQDTHSNDMFLISEFYIEIETYVQAGPTDTHAWLTDAALADSDEDGWSDYYEIYTSGTNPLNKDSDGDSAWDPNDRDPFRDVMIEISPLSGSLLNQIWPLPSPSLEIIIQFHVNDLIDPDFSEDTSTIGFCTTPQIASNLPNGYYKAWWNTGEGHHYYFDISDDKTIQSNIIPFDFQLWLMNSGGDLDLFGTWLRDNYSINQVGYFEVLYVERGTIANVYCKIDTIAIERANTIAIFNPNGTDFTGHYNEAERMNIIQLHVTEDENNPGSSCKGTPFKPGPNIIVIPTSLFEKTVLNSFIQNEQLDKTPLYTDQEGLFELYSVDRNGNMVDEQCGDTDFVFIRYNITVEDAMEILNSLLICATNQSTNENDETITDLEKVLDYVSTKLNGTNVVTLNLPHGILTFIPWIADLNPSQFGRAPVPFNFLALFTFMLFCILLLAFPLTALVFVIAVSIVAFALMFANLADSIGMIGLGFLGFLIWIIIRTVLLILFYILLAIELLTTSLLILPIGLSLMVLGGLMGISSNWGLNWWVPYGQNTRIGHINIEMNEMSICIEMWINWIYWEFFDLYFPIPDMDYSMNTTLDDPSTTPEPPSFHCGYKQIGGINSTKFDFYTIYQDENGDPPEYIILYLIAPDGSETPYPMTNRTSYNDKYLHLTGIEYNITIDFANKIPGQWFYYFKAKEDSILSSNARWPTDYYCEPGPFISRDGKPEDFYRYFLLADIDPYSGSIAKNFDFMVVGADFLQNKIPNNVFLNVLWSDGTIQSFLMKCESSYTIEIGEDSTLRNATFTTYGNTLDFSKFIDIDDPFIIRSYYSAEFPDGNSSVLFDYYEDKFYNNDFNLTAKKWFDEPTLIPNNPGGKPTIVGWKVEEVSKRVLADSTSSSQVPIGPIIDEQFLRFWVFISDPNGDHLYHMNEYGYVLTPKLILKNCDSANPIESIDMVWAGQNYDPYPDCDAYFIDMLPAGAYTHNYENFTLCDFGPGAWTFDFSITDHTFNVVNQRASNGGKSKKIWLIGSANQMWYTALNGYDMSGAYIDNIIPGAGVVVSIATTIAFISTAILSMTKTGQIIARYISMGILAFDIINSFIGLGILLFSGDTGALLGMGLGALISAAGAALAHFMGNLNIGNWNAIWKFSKYIFLVNLILSMICNPTILIKTKIIGFMILPGSGDEFDWDLPGEDMIRKVPSVLFNFFISILSLGAILNIASRACIGFTGNTPFIVNPVLKTIKYYTIFKIVISTLCIISFFIKMGMCHVIGDFYSNPSIIFGG